jgi:hypothetical protein
VAGDRWGPGGPFGRNGGHLGTPFQQLRPGKRASGLPWGAAGHSGGERRGYTPVAPFWLSSPAPTRGVNWSGPVELRHAPTPWKVLVLLTGRVIIYLSSALHLQRKSYSIVHCRDSRIFELPVSEIIYVNILTFRNRCCRGGMRASGRRERMAV